MYGRYHPPPDMDWCWAEKQVKGRGGQRAPTIITHTPPRVQRRHTVQLPRVAEDEVSLLLVPADTPKRLGERSGSCSFRSLPIPHNGTPTYHVTQRPPDATDRSFCWCLEL